MVVLDKPVGDRHRGGGATGLVGLVKSGFVPTGSISAQTWVPLVSPESRPSLVMKSPGTMQVLLVKLADTDTAAAGPSVKAVVACCRWRRPWPPAGTTGRWSSRG